MRSIHRCVALLVLGMLVPGPARPAELIVNGPPGSVAFGFEENSATTGFVSSNNDAAAIAFATEADGAAVFTGSGSGSGARSRTGSG